MEKRPSDSDSSKNGKNTESSSGMPTAEHTTYSPEPVKPFESGLIFERIVHDVVSDDKEKTEKETKEKEEKKDKEKEKSSKTAAPVQPPQPQREFENPPVTPFSESLLPNHDKEDDTEHADEEEPTTTEVTYDEPVLQQVRSEAVPQPVQPVEMHAEDNEMPTEDELMAAFSTPPQHRAATPSPNQPPQPSEQLAGEAALPPLVPNPNLQHDPWPAPETPGFESPADDLPQIHSPNNPAPAAPNVAANVPLFNSNNPNTLNQPLVPPTNPNMPAANATGNTLPPPGNLPPAPGNANFYNGPYDPNFVNTAMNPNAAPVPQANHTVEQTRVIEKGSGWGPAVAVGLVERHFRRKEDKKLRQANEKLGQQQLADKDDQRRLERSQNETNARLQQQQRDIRRMNQQEQFGAGVAAPFGAQPNTYPAREAHYAAAPRAVSAPRPEQFAQQPNIQEGQPMPEPQNIEQAIDYAKYENQQPARIEQDAWRRYAVDKHGREITPVTGHGEAFRQERHQEVRPDQPTGTNPVTSHVAGAAPAVGAFAAYGQLRPTQTEHYSDSLPSGMTTPSLPQGMPTQIDPQHRLPATDKTDSSIPGVWFWVMVGIIIVAFFAAALI